MDIQFAESRYTTKYLEDRTAGFAGIRLHRARFNKASSVAAEELFWDASGQFVVETFDGDVPADILEAVIAEARERVKVR